MFGHYTPYLRSGAALGTFPAPSHGGGLRLIDGKIAAGSSSLYHPLWMRLLLTSAYRGLYSGSVPWLQEGA